MSLWLVRHGDTEWSEQGRLCGWADPPLSEAGIEQAAKLHTRLRHRPFEGAWTSDLTRASEFARLSFGEAQPDMRLREIDFGDLEGKRWGDCDQETQAALMRFEGFTAPGGESVETLQGRVLGFLSDVGTGNQLVFTHGGVIRLLQALSGSGRPPRPGELVVLDWPIRGEKSAENGSLK
ncbi:MAG: histidine phosphatase family protein [Acidimicrobiia bacterium]